MYAVCSVQDDFLLPISPTKNLEDLNPYHKKDTEYS